METPGRPWGRQQQRLCCGAVPDPVARLDAGFVDPAGVLRRSLFCAAHAWRRAGENPLQKDPGYNVRSAPPGLPKTMHWPSRRTGHRHHHCESQTRSGPQTLLCCCCCCSVALCLSLDGTDHGLDVGESWLRLCRCCQTSLPTMHLSIQPSTMFFAMRCRLGCVSCCSYPDLER